MSDLEIIVVHEEEIYLAVMTALKEELPALIEEVNAHKKEQWFDPFASVLDSYMSMEQRPLPLVSVNLNEIAHKPSDPFVEQSSYLLKLLLRFDRTAPHYIAYRYTSVLKTLFKGSPTLNSVADRHTFDSLSSTPLPYPEAPGYPEALIEITLYRDEIL